MKKKFTIVRALKLLLFVISFSSGVRVNAQFIENSKLEKRIDTLINAMTVQEKLEQLYNNTFMTTPDNIRLNIPGFVMDDGPHGVRFHNATAFPTGIAMASTFDKTMLFNIGKAMGEEFWAFGKQQQLGPCIDLARDPRAGRSAESGGEDPYLSGQIGAAVIKGIQTTPVIATVKHLMVESKQAYRNSCNEIYTERWLMEHYGYNFRTAVQEGGSMSIMSSYNLINGIQAAQSDLLLHKVLRLRWGFPFYVVSDWGAVHDTKQAVIAGNDVCMGSDNYKNDLPTLVSSGQLGINYINAAVRNVLRTKILSGMMDYYPKADITLINSANHVKVTLEGARKSIILLKNQNNILPLNKTKITKIAVIGPNASKGNLNCFGSSETTPPYSISVLQGITTKLGAAKVVYSLGCDMNSTSVTGYADAKTKAAQADVVVFVGGLDDTQEGEAYSYGNDRASGSPDLPGKQQDLINQLAAVNPNMVVVLQSGGVCSVHSCISNIKGFIYSFYAGMEAGTAVADVLFGDYNPAGRMPVSMPTGVSQLPAWDDDFTNDFGCGYRWFDEKGYLPEFAFGFGLSYTKFDYTNLQISSTSIDAGAPVTISVDVQNVGKTAGEEVVQLYLTNKAASIWMPKKELKGYERISLVSGEKKTISFTLTSEDFYYWNMTSSTYDIFSGSYNYGVGGSSDNLRLTGSFQLNSASAKPDLKITQVYTMPRYPLKRQKVTFYALVKNQGSASVQPTDNFDIAFNIDTKNVANAKNISITLDPGQATLIASNDTSWIASNYGKHFLSAQIDENNSVAEWIESNNYFSRNIEVFNQTVTTNLALKKPVYVSSVENNDATLGGSYIVDGNMTSRWSSAFTDPQTVVIDLQKTCTISKINLYWEAAFASSYVLAVSADSVNWNVVKTTTTGKGGTETYPVTFDNQRYVRLICTKRSTAYGNSLYEIEVIDGSALAIALPPVAVAGSSQQITLPVNSTTLDGSASSDPSAKALTFTWEQLTGTSKATLTGANTSKVIVSNLAEGNYTFKLTVNNGLDTATDIANVQVLPAVRIEPITVGISKVKTSEVNVFPNPAKDVLNINLPENAYNRLCVFDITGRKVAEKNISAQFFNLNIAGLKAGLYLIAFYGNNGTTVQKIDVQ